MDKKPKPSLFRSVIPKISKHFARPLFVIVAVLVVVISGVTYVVAQHDHRPGRALVGVTHNPDLDTMQDLYKLQTAVDNSIKVTSITTSSGVHYMLPASLDNLHLTNLTGKISSYQYSFTRSTSGDSHTINYQLCAPFTTLGSKFTMYTGTVGNTVQAYKFHVMGQQCFAINYYQGSAFVSPVVADNPVTELSRSTPDVLENSADPAAKYEATVQTYYQIQTAALGLVSASSNNQAFVKTCAVFYPAHDEALYNCFIQAHQLIPSSADPTGINNRFVQLTSLLNSQGALATSVDQFLSPAGTDVPHYYQYYKTSVDHCTVTANYNAYDPTVLVNGLPSIDYQLNCRYLFTELPPGFRQLDPGTDPLYDKLYVNM
jgi:hypothetical protein